MFEWCSSCCIRLRALAQTDEVNDNVDFLNLPHYIQAQFSGPEEEEEEEVTEEFVWNLKRRRRRRYPV